MRSRAAALSRAMVAALLARDPSDRTLPDPLADAARSPARRVRTTASSWASVATAGVRPAGALAPGQDPGA
ncbi:hypothetical protein Rwratislav_38858, partial [Rhodococcus wratislaviensis IFP 2016]